MQAQRHLSQVAKDYKLEFSKHNKYMLVIMWGQGKDKLMDIYGHNWVGKWPGDTIAETWIMRNGILVKEKDFSIPELIVKDISIALSQEEAHRQNRNSLKDFINNPPHFIHDGKGHVRIVPK